MWTSAERPRRAQQARRGGNSRRLVSSSAKRTLRGGSCRTRRQIRSFFLALGVRVQDIAGSLPHIAHPAQLDPDRIIAEPPAGVVLQVLLKEGDCPIGGEIPQPVGG